MMELDEALLAEPTGEVQHVCSFREGRSITRVQVPVFRCSSCGTTDLIPHLTDHGNRLAYGGHWGSLAGKIHACEP